jgi:hypothetical protein
LIASAGFLKIDRLFLWRRQVRTKRAQGGHGQDDPVFVPVKLGIPGKNLDAIGPLRSEHK